MIVRNTLPRVLKVAGRFLIPGANVIPAEEIPTFQASKDFAARLKHGTLEVKVVKQPLAGKKPARGLQGTLAGLSLAKTKVLLQEMQDVKQLREIQASDPRPAVRMLAAARVEEMRKALEKEGRASGSKDEAAA